MKTPIIQALLGLALLAATCHCSDSKSRAKRQVSDNTGIVNIPDNIAGATPPPTAGPLTPGPTLPPTTASPGLFGANSFNFPSLFNFGGNVGGGFGNGGGGFGPGNTGGGFGTGNQVGGGGFPNFPSFPTPRPNTGGAAGGFGGGFPPINGNFPPISGGFPNNGGSNNNNNGGNTGDAGGNTGGNTGGIGGNTGGIGGNTGGIGGNTGGIGGNTGPGGFPDFGNFGGNIGGTPGGINNNNNNNPQFPNLPNFNTPGGNPFGNNFPAFVTRAPPTFPSVNLPTTPRPAFDTNICTPPVFTPLGDRVSNTSLPPQIIQAINQELSFNPQLAAFLSFAAQVNGAPLNVGNQEGSDLSCPGTVRQRATVFQRAGSNCWILQNEQQPYYYTTCKCNQCLSPTGFQQPPGSACEPYLHPTPVFAFCESSLNQQNKITQERVALPVTCRCRHAAPSATQTPPVNGGFGGGVQPGGGGQAVPANTTPAPGGIGGIGGIGIVPDGSAVVRA